MVTELVTSTSARLKSSGRLTFTLSRAGETTLAVALYLVLSVAFFGLHVLPHLGRDCVCNGTDAGTYMWGLAWWSHALVHGINPFFTNALYVPNRLDLGGVTLAPGAALVGTPMTLLFGPVVSYNVLMLASPVLAGVFAFLLCRYVSGNFLASLVGGYVFGFSAYMLGHMFGHLNLVLTFPIPAAVHLVLRMIDGRITARRFVVLMALDLAALISFSTETALTFVLLGGLALVLAGLLPSLRCKVKPALAPMALAMLLAAALASPVIYYALRGNVANANAYQGIGDTYGGDVLGFLIPTPVTALGGSALHAVSATFNGGNFAESTTYVGLPLALIMLYQLVARRRMASFRALSVVLAGVVILTLGSHLKVGGHATIALPWRAIGQLPLLRQLLPVRLGLYVFLITAMLVAMWLAEARRGRQRIARWTAAAAGIAFIFPNVISGVWHIQPPNPTFFTSAEYRRYLHRGENVLALPWADLGFSMLWQADTDMWFRMAEGYLGRLVPTDYQSDPMVLPLKGVRAAQPASLRSFLKRRQIGAVIVDPNDASGWPELLSKAGLRPLSTGDILFYRVPAAS